MRLIKKVFVLFLSLLFVFGTGCNETKKEPLTTAEREYVGEWKLTGINLERRKLDIYTMESETIFDLWYPEFDFIDDAPVELFNSVGKTYGNNTYLVFSNEKYNSYVQGWLCVGDKKHYFSWQLGEKENLLEISGLEMLFVDGEGTSATLQTRESVFLSYRKKTTQKETINLILARNSNYMTYIFTKT